MITNELRLGNWVTGKNDPPMQVAAISKGTVELYMPGSESDNFSYDDAEIKGIEISMKHLFNAGFTEQGNPYPFNSLQGKEIRLFKRSTIWIYFHDGQLYRVTTGSGAKDHLYIKSIHQLQNLIYIFTGQEMQFKISDPPPTGAIATEAQ